MTRNGKPLGHNIHRYKRHGCRCEVCSDAHFIYCMEQADKKRSQRNPEWFMEVDDYPPLSVEWIKENLPGLLEEMRSA